MSENKDAWSTVNNMKFLPVRHIQIVIAIFIFSTISSSAIADIFSCVKDGKNVKGKILKPAYASTNEKEYFAELSAIYFVGGNYYPFNKNDLKSYDPEGYALIEQLWGL